MPSMGSWGVPGREGSLGCPGWAGGSHIRLLRMSQVGSWGALYGDSQVVLNGRGLEVPCTGGTWGARAGRDLGVSRGGGGGLGLVPAPSRRSSGLERGCGAEWEVDWGGYV